MIGERLAKLRIWYTTLKNKLNDNLIHYQQHLRYLDYLYHKCRHIIQRQSNFPDIALLIEDDCNHHNPAIRLDAKLFLEYLSHHPWETWYNLFTFESDNDYRASTIGRPAQHRRSCAPTFAAPPLAPDHPPPQPPDLRMIQRSPLNLPPGMRCLSQKARVDPDTPRTHEKPASAAAAAAAPERRSPMGYTPQHVPPEFFHRPQKCNKHTRNVPCSCDYCRHIDKIKRSKWIFRNRFFHN